MIQLASSLRIALFSALVTAVLFPHSLALQASVALPAALLRLSLAGVLIGAVEAGTARLKLSRIASFLMVATVLAAIALAIQYAG